MSTMLRRLKLTSDLAIAMLLATALLLLSFPVQADAATPKIAAGQFHTVALKCDGTVVAWGDNSYGQLGDTTTTQRLIPTAVTGMTDITAIAAGVYHTVALKNDGTVLAWGGNGSGQLGDGTTTQRLTPTPVPGLSGVIALSAGAYHTVALKNDGTVVAWGNNVSGQLGDGTTTQQLTPTAVQGVVPATEPLLSGITAIAAGEYHTIALRSDGTIVAWGKNADGQLGIGTFSQQLPPVAVPGLTDVTAITAGYLHSAALKNDGTVSAWGNNYYGQVGIPTEQRIPTIVPGMNRITAITAGGFHTVALKSDGTVLAMGWGQNAGSNTSAPVAVPGLTGVTAISGGYQHTTALENDGSVVSWGNNEHGQYGDAGTTGSAVPIQAANSLNVSSACLPVTQPVTWIAAGSGNWSDGVNWSGGAAPTAADDVVINDGPYTVTMAANTVVKSLAMSGATLNATGAFYAGTFAMSGGTFSQISAALPDFKVNDFRLTGGTFIRALGGDGSSAAPYQLTDIYGVQGMGSAGMLAKSYVLANNIDAAGTVNWNDGAGFMPVGTTTGIYYVPYDGMYYPNAFSGVLDGSLHTVSNLTLDRPSTDYVGLFGKVYAGVIRNVGIVNATVSGKSYVGALAGDVGGGRDWASGTVTNCYTTGTVNGSYIGGLVGYAYGIQVTIKNSYSAATVNGTTGANGGLVGTLGRGIIENCYAAGNVTNGSGLLGYSSLGHLNNSYAYGLVTGGAGLLDGSPDWFYVVNSFWDIESTGQTAPASPSVGQQAIGLTTAQMKTIARFTDWNISSIGGTGAAWRIYEGHTYPLLTSFMTPLTLNDAPDVYTTYNGAEQSGASSSVSGILGTAARGTDVGVHNGYYSTQMGYDISGGNLIIKADQNITFGEIPTIVVAGTGTVTANATSGLPVTFSTTTSGFCSVSNGIVTGISAGICTITAQQAGNLTYNAAAPVTRDISIGKAEQTINFNVKPSYIPFHETGPVAATATSGLVVTFSSTTPAICTVSGTTVTSIGAGDCVIAADQSGDSNYKAAPTVTQGIPIPKGNQTISFDTAPVIGVGGSGTVSASATSGLAVIYVNLSPDICSLIGSTVTGISAGLCSIAAQQAGDANYNAAPQVTQNISVVSAANSAPLFAITEGKVSTTFGSSSSSGMSVIEQPDGRILVAGSAQYDDHTDFALVRYNNDGTLDSSFGNGTGKVITPYGGTAHTVLLHPDGKIIVAGSSTIARYTSAGVLDTTYGSGGIVAGGGEKAFLLPDDSLLVVGNIQIFYTASNFDFSLIRFFSDGSRDTSFGHDTAYPGIIRTEFGSWDFGNSIAQQADGKILLSGYQVNRVGTQNFLLARYDTDFTLDPTFNAVGTVATDFVGLSAHARNVLVQADGKIVVSGETMNGDFAAARYNQDGSLDDGFNADGKILTDFSGGNDIGNASILQNGKLLMAGYSMGARATVDALARYNYDGSLDGSFGNNGRVTTFFGDGGDHGAKSVTLQNDGKILVAGDNNVKFTLTRYNADGSVDTSFGKFLYTPPVFNLGDSPVVLDTAIQVYDPELDAAGNYSGASLTLRRNGGASSEDIFTASGTLGALTPGNPLTLNGTEIGTVITNSAGKLTLGFNSAATQQLIATAMQQISYRYDYHDNAAAPLPTILIDWIFHDGNSGAQGSGGGLSSTRTTEVTITGIPTRVNGVCGSADKTIVTLAPAANLCDDGSLPAVTGSGPWLWTCQGHYGGTPADCSAILPTLSVYVAVNGTLTSGIGGTVTSSPAGISCSNNLKESIQDCSGSFSGTVNLYATPSVLSTFGGWSGGAGCSGNGACVVTMDGNKSISATFNQATLLHIEGSPYTTLQQAYEAATDGDVIQMLQTPTTALGTLTADRPITVKLKGGYDANYTTITGSTTITAPLTIKSGKVVMDEIVLK